MMRDCPPPRSMRIPYGIALPQTIGGLTKRKDGLFSRYEDFSGNVTYDVNAVRYGGSDGLRALSVSLKKTVFLPFLSRKPSGAP